VFVDTHTQEGRHKRGPKESSPTEQSNTRASHQCLTYVLNACTVCHKEQIRSFHTKIVSFASSAYRIGTSSMRDRHSERFLTCYHASFCPLLHSLFPKSASYCFLCFSGLSRRPRHGMESITKEHRLSVVPQSGDPSEEGFVSRLVENDFGTPF